MSGREAYTPVEVAEKLGLDERTIRRCINQGSLPGSKLGTRYRIPMLAFERYLAGDWIPAPKPAAPTPIGLVRRKAS